MKINLKSSHTGRSSNYFISDVPSRLHYSKIRLSQLPRETKTQSHHTTVSHDKQKPADPFYPCANAEMLQDALSADAPCAEVTVGR